MLFSALAMLVMVSSGSSSIRRRTAIPGMLALSACGIDPQPEEVQFTTARLVLFFLMCRWAPFSYRVSCGHPLAGAGGPPR